MARGDGKDPLDVEAVQAGIGRALPLQLRSANAYTLASAALVGFEYVGLAALLADAGEQDLRDARRLAEKLVTLGGAPGDTVPGFDLPRAPDALVRRLIELEAETIEALQDIIPATGQTGASEALEHRLEHMIMRKQEVVDALERARRGADGDGGPSDAAVGRTGGGGARPRRPGRRRRRRSGAG